MHEKVLKYNEVILYGGARITCLLGAGAAVEIGVLYQRMLVFGGICVDLRRLLANIKKEIFTFG